LIIGFQDTVENVGDVFLGHSVDQLVAIWLLCLYGTCFMISCFLLASDWNYWINHLTEEPVYTPSVRFCATWYSFWIIVQ